MSSHLDKVSDAIPDSAKQFYGRYKWLAPWLVGGIVGLVLGLIIGWVVWPVEWTNARLSDLSKSERAAYISAVADAFVLDGSGYQEVNMNARLAGFGDKLADEVLGAIEYYRADATADQVQLGNLALLATELGIPVDASVMQSTAPAVDAAVATTTDTESAGALASAPVTTQQLNIPEAEKSGGTGIWTWLLAILVAGGLIGGGLYLLRYLNKRALPSDDLVAPPPANMPGEIRAPQELDSTGGPRKASLWRNPTRRQSKSPDDLSFDEEEEDEEPAVRFGSGGLDDDFDDEDDDDPVNDQRYSVPASQPDRSSTPNFPAAAVSAPYNGPSFGGSYSGASYNTPSSGGTATLEAATATVEAVRPAPVPVRTAPKRRAEAAAAPVLDRKVIASFTCEYHTGIADYIDAHNINDPVEKRYIGECGLCVSSKNRALHNNPDQVIALEVWMYDKLDPRDNVNNTRVLLSEYAADRGFAQAFARDGSTQTILAQPGARFEMEGRNLVLEGEVVSVDYDREGIFTRAKVVLNVLARR